MKVTFCDWCGQQITDQSLPQIRIAIQSPSPQTSPDLCSYACASAWLQNRAQVDITNGVTGELTTAVNPTTLTLTPTKSALTGITADSAT
jgi:hypothetical protein